MKKRIISIFLMLSLILMNISSVAMAAEGENSQVKVSEALNKLRAYYSTREMDYLTALSYAHSSDDYESDKVLIAEKLKRAVNTKNARNCFKGIMGALSIEGDPTAFECNEQVLDYVSGLYTQYNKVKHNFYSQDDVNSNCIIALDMAAAEYDKEAVINALVDNFDKNKSIRKAPLILTALALHRDLPRAEEGIEKYKEYIKDAQKDDGGFDGSGSYYPVPTAISTVIQAVIALGEDPMSEEWSKNGKTMVDALLSYGNMEDGSFSDNNAPSSWIPATTNDAATVSAFAALSDLYRGKSMYKAFGKESGDEDPEPKVIASSISILIDGKEIENSLDMKVDETKDITSEVKDENGSKIDEASASLSIKEGDSVALEGGKIRAVSKGTSKVTATYEGLSKEVTINVAQGEIVTPDKPENNKEELNKVIKEIKQYYMQKEGKYEVLENMALIFSGVNKDDIKSKINIYDYDDSIKCLAEDIMNIKLMEEDPTNYNGKNYVDLLMNLNGKFYNYSSYSYVNFVSKAIMALDMAGTDYNKEEAVKALMSKATEEDISASSEVVIAISNHMDVQGVDEFIEKYKNNLKSVQSNCFQAQTSGDLSKMIIALIAIGENPLSSEWTSNDSDGNKLTMVDALLKYKEGPQFKADGSKYSDPSDVYTQQAFAALLSLVNGKSIYTSVGKQEINIKNISITSDNYTEEVDLNKKLQLNAHVIDELDNEIKGKEIIWESSNEQVATVDLNGLVTGKSIGNAEIKAKLKENENISAIFNIQVVDNLKNFIVERIGNDVLINGNDANIKVKVTSNIEKEKEAAMIVALYNTDSNKMEIYCCDKKVVQPQGEEIFKTGFSIPKDGNYNIKIFTWDNMDNMNPYSDSISLNVEK